MDQITLFVQLNLIFSKIYHLERHFEKNLFNTDFIKNYKWTLLESIFKSCEDVFMKSIHNINILMYVNIIS